MTKKIFLFSSLSPPPPPSVRFVGVVWSLPACPPLFLFLHLGRSNLIFPFSLSLPLLRSSSSSSFETSNCMMMSSLLGRDNNQPLSLSAAACLWRINWNLPSGFLLSRVSFAARREREREKIHLLRAPCNSSQRFLPSFHRLQRKGGKEEEKKSQGDQAPIHSLERLCTRGAESGHTAPEPLRRPHQQLSALGSLASVARLGSFFGAAST